jgi:RNA polymerase sigma factor (sigma-70 family)
LLEEQTADPRQRQEVWRKFHQLRCRRLRRLAVRMKAPADWIDDLIQETWYKTLEHWEWFRTQPNGARQLLGWSRKVLHDRLVDLFRERDRHRAKSVHDVTTDQVKNKEVEPANVLQTREQHERAATLLEKLRQEQPLDCWMLCEHYLNARAHKELAEETGLTVNSIRNRISRALKKLRRWAAESDD